MRLYLIRHGQSEGNAAGIVQGRLDYGLTPLGKRQAEETARYLRELSVERVISSPLARAMETAEVIAGQVGLTIETDGALAEYDMGEASGLTPAQVRERFPQAIEAYARNERKVFPGEEGRDRFRQRVEDFLERVRTDGRNVIAVGHGGVLNIACHIVLGMEYSRVRAFHAANCSLTEFATDRTGRYVLLRHNDACHLAGMETARELG